jgi:hypothetical protein
MSYEPFFQRPAKLANDSEENAVFIEGSEMGS